jgi:hypothetical protein
MASDDPQPTDDRAKRAANLFDLRRIIGGLFLVYGVILVVLGLGASNASIAKSAGVHINLWAGIGMLVLGGLFLVWAFTRPLGEQLEAAASDEGGRGTRRDRERPGGGPHARPE